MLEMLAYVGGSRWPIGNGVRDGKGRGGAWTEYETRSWAGWHHQHSHVPAGRSVPAGPAAGLGGKRCPGSRGPKCTGWYGRCCLGNGSDRRNCCCGWRKRSYATSARAAPTRDAAPPAVKAGWSHHPKAVVVVLDCKSTAGGLPRQYLSRRRPRGGPQPTSAGIPQLSLSWYSGKLARCQAVTVTGVPLHFLHTLRNADSVQAVLELRQYRTRTAEVKARRGGSEGPRGTFATGRGLPGPGTVRNMLERQLRPVP